VATTLSIQVNKFSPAYVALEEARIDFFESAAKSIQPVQEVIQLIAGKSQIKPRFDFKDHKSSPQLLAGMTVSATKRSVEVSIYNERGELLPLEERKKVLAQQYADYDLTYEKVTDRIQKIVKQELEEQAQLPKNEKVIFSRGAPIYV